MKHHLTYNKVVGFLAVLSGLLILLFMEQKIIGIATIVWGVACFTKRFREPVTKRWQAVLMICAAAVMILFVLRMPSKRLGAEERRQIEREMRSK